MDKNTQLSDSCRIKMSYCMPCKIDVSFLPYCGGLEMFSQKIATSSPWNLRMLPYLEKKPFADVTDLSVF